MADYDYDLFVIPNSTSVPDTLAFCKLLGITLEEFETKMQSAKKYSYVKPSLFVKQMRISR